MFAATACARRCRRRRHRCRCRCRQTVKQTAGIDVQQFGHLFEFIVIGDGAAFGAIDPIRRHKDQIAELQDGGQNTKNRIRFVRTEAEHVQRAFRVREIAAILFVGAAMAKQLVFVNVALQFQKF